MSDRGRGQGRGGGRGGGRGDSRGGGRGGGGRGGGRGGGGGGGGGDSYPTGGFGQPRGGGGDGYRGGGGGGGGYRGGRGGGGGGDGYRGGGGGGGFRGGRGGSNYKEIPKAYQIEGTPLPKPNADVEKLEDDLMAKATADLPMEQLTKKVAKMGVAGVQLPGVQLPGPPKGKSKGKGKGKGAKAEDSGAAPAAKTETITVASGSGPAASAAGDIGPLDFKRPYLPLRPAYSAGGTPVKLWANYFEVKVDDLKTMYQYNALAYKKGSSDGGAEARKALTGPFVQRVITYAVDNILSKGAAGTGLTVASEFKSKIITLAKIPNETISALRDFTFDGARLEVVLDGPVVLDMDAMRHWLRTMKDERDASDTTFPKFTDLIDAVGIVVGHNPRLSQSTVAVGGNRFFPVDRSSERFSLRNQYYPLEAIRGYFQSVRPATGRLLLNVNVTHGVFRGMSSPGTTLADLLDQYKPSPMLHKFLKGARVVVTFPDKQTKHYTCHGLAMAGGKFKKPQELNVDYVERVPVPNLKTGNYTVKEYLQRRYLNNKNVLRTDIPAISLGTRVFYPAEWCQLASSQSYTGKLGGDETAEMIKFACRRPADNATSIMTLGRQVLELDKAGSAAFLSKFGVSVGKHLVVVNARVLPAPQIKYFDSTTIRPQRGSWNLVEVTKLAKPAAGNVPWTWVAIDPYNLSVVRAAMDGFTRALDKNLGVQLQRSPLEVPNYHSINIGRQSREGVTEMIRKVFSFVDKAANKPKIVFFVLPNNDRVLYECIKLLGDTVYGVHTVCMVGSKMTKKRGDAFDTQYFANVGLKVNLKLGGANHKLSNEAQDLGIVSEGKTMVVGYDVIHPTNLGNAKSTRALPSFVGLVASVDRYLAQWPAYHWAQQGRQEMTDNVLETAMATRFALWDAHNQGRAPENILIYRDGVSEGQFTQVLEQELPHIRAAYSKRYPGQAMARITVVVSVKRHHTRFFPTETGDKTGNVSCGTVVDRGVTLQRYWDFFLTAHAAIQGTARPARYTVIYDEIFKAGKGRGAAGDLERLTHNMCYLFNRATKAVGICPPAYYADLVCTRARVYDADRFDKFDARADDMAGTVEESGTVGSTARVHPALADTMFYI